MIALTFLTIISALVYAAPTSYTPTIVPSSISCFKHENDKSSVCCGPSTWTSVLTFYATNYFAHAATTRTSPGRSTFVTACTIVLALLFPTSGALRGARAIWSGAVFADTDLQTAARAGALCMVAKLPATKIVGCREGQHHSCLIL